MNLKKNDKLFETVKLWFDNRPKESVWVNNGFKHTLMAMKKDTIMVTYDCWGDEFSFEPYDYVDEHNNLADKVNGFFSNKA